MVLAAAAGAFYLPLFAGWGTVFRGQIAYLFYPLQSYLGRTGGIPFWSPGTYCGAGWAGRSLLPLALYLPNRLLLGMGGAGCLWSVEIPLAVHSLAAVFSTYLLARSVAGLRRPGATAMALAYAFGLPFARALIWPPAAWAYCWIPLICVFPGLFLRTGKIGWLGVGSLVAALVSPAGGTAAGLAVPAVPLLFWIVPGWPVTPAPRRGFFLKAPAAAAVMTGIALLLGGIYWAQLLGVPRWSALPGFEGLESARIRAVSLAAVPLPDLFGGISGRGGWGIWESGVGAGAFPGGFAAFGVVVLAALAAGKGNRRGPMGRFCLLAAAGLAVLLLVPHPLSRLVSVDVLFFAAVGALSLGMAGIFGVSVEKIWDRNTADLPVRRAVVVASALALAAAAWALFCGYGNEGTRGYALVGGAVGWGRFLLENAAYPAAVAVFLLAAGRWLPSVFGRLAAGAAVIELFALSFLGVYVGVWPPWEAGGLLEDRSPGPLDSPVYWRLREFHQVCPDRDGHWRRAYFDSALAAPGNCFGSDSALGLGGYPLNPAFAQAVQGVVGGYPFQLRAAEWGDRFWQNMSVRYFIAREGLEHPDLIGRGSAGGWRFYEYRAALPRIYVQDRWIGAEREKELLALRYYDIREVGYLDPQVWDVRPLSERFPEHTPMGRSEAVERFKRLQRENPVSGGDFSDPARVEFEVLCRKPLMAVLTDVWDPGWRVTVNGAGQTLYRVNFLQRGVWLRPGRNRVAMEYFPPRLGLGLLLTVLGLAGLAVLPVFPAKRREDG